MDHNPHWKQNLPALKFMLKLNVIFLLFRMLHNIHKFICSDINCYLPTDLLMGEITFLLFTFKVYMTCLLWRFRVFYLRDTQLKICDPVKVALIILVFNSRSVTPVTYPLPFNDFDSWFSFLFISFILYSKGYCLIIWK